MRGTWRLREVLSRWEDDHDATTTAGPDYQHGTTVAEESSTKDC
jgi:hypothetical protein